jgi:hypothetical protein
VPAGTGPAGSGARNPMSSAVIASYSSPTGSPTARLISSTSAAPVGAGTAGARPADQASTASTAAARISARTGSGKPPASLSSMPRLRVGR